MPAEAEPISIAEIADETHRPLLQEFLDKVTRAPRSVQRSLELYDRDPEVVSDLVGLLSENPEEFSILRTVVQVFSDGADAELDIAPVIAEKIERDPELQRQLDKARASASPEARKVVMNGIRRFWIRKALGHIAAA